MVYYRRLWSGAALLVLLLIVLYAILARVRPGRRALPSATHNAYIDPEVCASCHKDVAERYQHTAMRRSIYRPTTTNVIEDYKYKNKLYNRRSDTYYTMTERDGIFYQRRHQIGPDGREVNSLEERVDYVIGSGDQARSYLHRNSEGRLIELPVSWYSEAGGYWAMTPGYDQAAQEDFHGSISYDCIFCHDAYPRAIASQAVRESGEPIFVSRLPEGIDCQRCHGPGKEHVEAASSDKATISQIRDAIVNPARLSRERQLEVCMECHLSTSGSQGANVSRRLERDVFSYIPGQPLSGYKLYFDQAGSEQNKGGFKIVDAAYRLSFSACFRKSKMTCLTCHDPHVQDHGEDARMRYTKICEGCHQSVRHSIALPAGQTCLSCHMPRRRSQYAVHLVLTDHYIQREMPQGDLLAPLNEPEDDQQPSGNRVLFHPSRLPDTPENDAYLAAAQLEGSPGNANDIQTLQRAIGRYKAAPAEFLIALGKAYARTGNAPEAERWLDQALSRRPDFRPAVEALAEVLFSEEKYERAVGILKQAVATPPLDSALFADLGNAYARQGLLDQAQAAIQRSIEINPEAAQSYNLLGLISIQRGDEANAERYFREALRCQPDLAQADDNLGKIFMGNRDYARAGYYLKKAIASDPKDADSHHSYGLLLMLTKSYGPAIQEMRQATALDPAGALTYSDLGDLLAAQGSSLESEREYEHALQHQPDLPQANLGLGLLLRRRSEMEKSRKFCQIASRSPDPSIRSAALQCLR